MIRINIEKKTLPKYEEALMFEKELITLYTEASDLKEQGTEDSEKYIQSSEVFGKCSKLLETLIDLPLQQTRRGMYFYFLYEEQRVLSIYYYEQKLYRNALVYLFKSKYYIDCAIECAKSISSDTDRLNNSLEHWQIFRENDKIFELDIKASKALQNEGGRIKALDFYRLKLELYIDLKNKIKEKTIKGIFDPSIIRIINGNYYATLANEQLFFANYFLNQTFDINTISEVLSHLLGTLNFGKQAFKENPELSQYHILNQNVINNIEGILDKHKNNWKEIYLNIEDKGGIRHFMQKKDHKKFKKIEKQLLPIDSKSFKYSKICSVILPIPLIFLITIYFIARDLSILKFIIALTGTEVLTIIVSAIILRIGGDLSEANMVKLITIAFQNQKSILGAIVKKISEMKNNSDKKSSDLEG
nr:hypothetical protein [Fredinandcohnia onubensis]